MQSAIPRFSQENFQAYQKLLPAWPSSIPKVDKIIKSKSESERSNFQKRMPNLWYSQDHKFRFGIG